MKKKTYRKDCKLKTNEKLPFERTAEMKQNNYTPQNRSSHLLLLCMVLSAPHPKLKTNLLQEHICRSPPSEFFPFVCYIAFSSCLRHPMPIVVAVADCLLADSLLAISCLGIQFGSPPRHVINGGGCDGGILIRGCLCACACACVL